MSNAVQQVRRRVPRLEVARRARLRLVPRRRTTAARVPFIILVTLMLVGGVVGLLLFNTSMQQASFAATKLERQATTLAAREQTLLLELEDLRDPQRVARAAVGQGMVPNPGAAFLSLPDGKILGTPAVAEASDALRIDARPSRRTGPLVPRREVVRLPASSPVISEPGRDTALGSPLTAAPAGRNGEGTPAQGGGEEDARGADARTSD